MVGDSLRAMAALVCPWYLPRHMKRIAANVRRLKRTAGRRQTYTYNVISVPMNKFGWCSVRVGIGMLNSVAIHTTYRESRGGC